jgi:signal transduction histidine kinase
VSPSAVPGRLAAAGDLRQRLCDNELFCGLTEDQLNWVAAACEVQELGDGDVLLREGEPASRFYALLDGELVVTKVMDGRDEVLTRHVVPAPANPTPDGKLRAANYFTNEMPLLTDEISVATITVSRHAIVLAFSKAAFFELITRCPDIASVILPVLAWRVKSSELRARNQATIAALGTLAAGLAHQLNNPASAVVRAAGELADAVGRFTATACEWGARATPRERDILNAARAEFGGSAHRAGGSADDDDAIFQWAIERGAGDPAGLSGALADLGVTAAALESRLSGLSDSSMPAALDHLSAVLELAELAADLRTAGSAISALVSAIRGYANMDRAPERVFVITEGIDATLAVLRHKLANIRLVRAYEQDLPRITGNPSELNQVWTTLIDNAVDAMDGTGTLTVRVQREIDCVRVELADTGCGIPAATQQRIFEPFYTTKEVGQGTGLGLHLSHRIVTRSHGGSIGVTSVPGATRFLVRLPIDGRAAAAACAARAN